jgi:hypothetical protein
MSKFWFIVAVAAWRNQTDEREHAQRWLCSGLDVYSPTLTDTMFTLETLGVEMLGRFPSFTACVE